MPIRFEEARVAPDFAEVITARAVGGFSDVLRWAKNSSCASRARNTVAWGRGLREGFFHAGLDLEAGS